MEALSYYILKKIHSVDEKITEINKKNSENLKKILDSINNILEYEYLVGKIKTKRQNLLAEIDQILIVESKRQIDNNKSKWKFLAYLKSNKSFNASNQSKKLNKVTRLYYKNEFKLKKKILYFPLMNLINYITYPEKYQEPDNYRLDLKIYLINSERFAVLDNRNKELKIEDRHFNVLFKLDLNPKFDCYMYLFNFTIVTIFTNEITRKCYIYTLDFNLNFLKSKDISDLIYVSDKSIGVDFILSRYDQKNKFILKLIFTLNQNQSCIQCTIPNKYLIMDISNLHLVEQFNECSTLATANHSVNDASNFNSTTNQMSFIYLPKNKIIIKNFTQREVEFVCSVTKSSKQILKNSPFSSNVMVDSDLNFYILTKHVDQQLKYLHCFNSEGELQFKTNISLFDDTITKFDMYDEKLFFSKRFKLVEVL